MKFMNQRAAYCASSADTNGVSHDPAVNSDPLLNRQQAAVYLGSKVKTMDNMRVRRVGPPFVKLGGRVLYRKSALDTYIASCEISTGPEAA